MNKKSSYKGAVNFLSRTTFVLTAAFAASSCSTSNGDDVPEYTNVKNVVNTLRPPNVVPKYRSWRAHHKSWEDLGGYFNAIQATEHRSVHAYDVYGHERLFRLSQDLRWFWRSIELEESESNENIEERCIPVYEASRVNRLREHGADIPLTAYQENSAQFIDTVQESDIGKDLIHDAIINDRWLCAVDKKGTRYLSEGKEVSAHNSGVFYYDRNVSTYTTSITTDCDHHDKTVKFSQGDHTFFDMLFTQFHELGHAAQDGRLEVFDAIESDYYLEDRVFFYASAEAQQLVVDALVRAEFIMNGQEDLIGSLNEKNIVSGGYYSKAADMILNIGMEEIKKDVSLLEPVYMEALRSNYMQMMIVYHWNSQWDHKDSTLKRWEKYPKVYADEKEQALPWEEYKKMYGRLPLTGFEGNIFSHYEGGMEDLMRQIPAASSVGEIWHKVLDVRGEGRSTEFEFGGDRDHDKSILSLEDPLACDHTPA